MKQILILLVLIICQFIYTQNVNKVLCTSNVKCGIGGVACTQLNSYLGLTVELNNGIQSIYYPYCLWVDQVHQIALNGSYNWLSQSSNLGSSYVRLWVPSGYSNGKDVSSDYRYFFQYGTLQNSTNKSFVIFYQAYVTLNQGLFSNGYNSATNTSSYPIFFDQNMCTGITLNGNQNYYCVMDTSQLCVNNIDCGAQDSSWLNAAYAASTSKDVKILIGFSGTDRNLNYLQSANQLPSKFRSFSFSSYYGLIASVTVPSN